MACGAPVEGDVELCEACRTERVPAALGAELVDDDSELLDDRDLIEEPSRYPQATRFVGRKAQLERLHAIIKEAARGEVAFVALTGPAGVGKTRLVEELSKQLYAKPGERGARMLVAPAGGPGAPPFAAFDRVLRQRFGLTTAMSPELARARLSQAVAELVPGPRAMEITHLLAQLLGVPYPESPVVEPLAETPAQLEARTFIALKRLLAADAAKTPLVIAIDDVERASPETINLLHYLAAGLGSSPVTLLCVARPSLFETHPAFGEGDADLVRVELGPLDDAEAAELFVELCRPAGAPPESLLKHARERMGGVPRALTELVRYLLELGAITNEDGKWQFDPAALQGATLPDDLWDVVAERLRVMNSAERDLLEKAAACGEAFWLDAVVMLVRAAAVYSAASGSADPDGPTLGEVAAAGDRTRAEVEAALAELGRRGLVVEQPHASIPGEREYRFAYPPWWEIVYGGIDGAARSRYHKLVAQWLELRPTGRGEEEQEEIGRHLERAGDGDGASLRYRRAGDAARARYFNDKAVRLYDAALNCLGQGDLASRIHLWHDLGSVFQLKGEFDSALTAFERMLRLAWVVASRTKAAVAFNKMGRVYRQKGELPMALEYLERGLELFEQAGDKRGIAGSLDDVGQVLWLLARYDEALDRSASALESRRRLGDRRAIAVSLVNIGNIERHRGLFDEAEACYQEAHELRRALGDQAGIAECDNVLGVLAFQRGDIDGAHRIWEAALAQAERIGALPLQALLLSQLGEAARLNGQRGEARTRFDAALALARDLDDKRILSQTERHLGLLMLEGGDPKGGLTHCERALELAEAAGIRVDVGRALVALGQVHAATLFDDTGSGERKAEELFTHGVELFREIGNEAELASALERFGRYRVERGDVDAGKQLLTEAEGIFRKLGMRAGDALRRVIGEL
ncbi:MAG TPA: tetratricopeptide repeat protein [Polyangia bacterium]|nr:tetratricopeptide repeat protein [Polyangia bacterium]